MLITRTMLIEDHFIFNPSTNRGWKEKGWDFECSKEYISFDSKDWALLDICISIRMKQKKKTIKVN